MLLEKAIKYKILEFCIDKFFETLSRNLSSNATKLDNIIIRVYRGYPIRSNYISLIAMIETPDFQIESSITLEDCMDIFASVGNDDGINEITEILYIELISGIPIILSDEMFKELYSTLESKIMEVLGVSKGIIFKSVFPGQKMLESYKDFNNL